MARKGIFGVSLYTKENQRRQVKENEKEWLNLVQ